MIQIRAVHELVGGLIFLYNLTIQKKGGVNVLDEYIKRLRMCGYNAFDAFIIANAVAREFGLDNLAQFVDDIEKDREAQKVCG